MSECSLYIAPIGRIFYLAAALGKDEITLLRLMPRRRNGIIIYGVTDDGQIVGAQGSKIFLLSPEHEESFGSASLLLRRLKSELAALAKEPNELRDALENRALKAGGIDSRQRAIEAIQDELYVLYNMSWERAVTEVEEEYQIRENWRAGFPGRKAAEKDSKKALAEKIKNPPINNWWEDPDKQSWH